MRVTRFLREAEKEAKFHYHVVERSPFWRKVREALVVNPDTTTGSPVTEYNRTPEPGSRPELFITPASKASDVAENPYYLRDFRRQYPQTTVVTQKELATLLLVGGEKELTALPTPPPQPKETVELALAGDASAPSLTEVFKKATPSKSFRAPFPPGYKPKWKACPPLASDKAAYFPLVNFTTEV